MESINCILCDSYNTLLLYENPIDYDYGTKHLYNLHQCKDCESIFINPIPKTSEEIMKMYPYNYYTISDNIKKKKLNSILETIYTKRQLYFIHNLINTKKRILDVGCGSGKFLQMLYEFNNSFELFGIDIILPDELKFHKNINFITSDFLNYKFPNNYFDIIRMSNLIEHVTNPKVYISKSYNLLKKGGVLVGETPNSFSLSHKFWKSFWGPLHTPRHLVIFNKNNLTQLFKCVGFKDIKIYPTLRPTGWAKSMKNFLVHMGLIQPIDHRSKIYPILLFFSSPFIIGEYVLNRTSIMGFFAKK